MQDQSNTDFFSSAGVDRVLLRNPDPIWREKEIQQGVATRRLSGVTPEDIERARTLLRTYISEHPAPLIILDSLNEHIGDLLGHPLSIHLLDTTVMRKDEHRSGSFKDYAPIELYESVASGSIPKEVHTVSTGNHAFAVANAAHRVNEIHGLSIKVIATMDKGAYPHKKDNVRSKGAIVREVNPYLFLKKGFPWNVINLIYRVMTYLHLMPKKSIRSYKEGEDVVNFEAEIKKDAMRIPHDNRYTARGYAVMVIEALKQMKTEGIDIENLHGDEIAALVPLGSGGLMRGWLELTALLDAPVYGVSTPPATSVFDSIRNGKALREEVPSDLSFKSDGILATTEETALRAIIQMGAGALLVRDKDAFMATALLASHGITVESTSGLPLAAAILHRDLFRETTHILIPLSSRHVHKSHKDEMQSLIDRPEEIEEYFRKRQKEVERALGEVPSNGHTKHKNNKILSKV